MNEFAILKIVSSIQLLPTLATSIVEPRESHCLCFACNACFALQLQTGVSLLDTSVQIGEERVIAAIHLSASYNLTTCVVTRM